MTFISCMSIRLNIWANDLGYLNYLNYHDLSTLILIWSDKTKVTKISNITSINRFIIKAQHPKLPEFPELLYTSDFLLKLCVEITLLPKFPRFYIFFECVKAAHNDFCTKLPNYILYHFFFIFSSGGCKKRGHITYISKKREFFWWKNRTKNYQITYITGAFIFWGG